MATYRYENFHETKLLLKEYSDLKRLIDAHRKLHSSPPGPNKHSTYNQNLKLIRKPSKYKTPVKTNSKYKFSRIGLVPPKSANDVNRFTAIRHKYSLNRVLNQNEVTNQVGLVSNVVLSKPQQVSLKKEMQSSRPVTKDNHPTTAAIRISTGTVTNSTPFFKPEEPSCSKSRTVSSTNPLKSLPTADEKKLNSKYKLVKLNSNYVSPPKVCAKKTKLGSKYSWSLNQKCVEKSRISNSTPFNFENRDTRPNVLETKYKLSKIKVNGNNNLIKKSPKLIRRVNKYSVKYTSIPIKQRFKSSPYVNRYRSNTSFIKSHRRNFQQKCSAYSSVINRNISKHRKSELVVIGGIFYKASKNKLSRTERTKAEKFINVCPVRKKQSTGDSGNKLKIVTVRGVKFSMDLNRKVLKRLPLSEDKATLNKGQKLDGNSEKRPLSHGPTRIDIGGETYIQTRPGVLIRSTATHARTAASRILTRSIYRLKVAKNKSEQFCMFYNKFGKCSNKETGKCPYIHDPDKIAVCKRFLRGECTIQDCRFSHKICRTKMPVCTFFLHGRCSSDSCNYRHVNVNPNADICLDFAKGYCSLGEQCKKWHVTVCQQFEQSGHCERGEKCPLIHKRRIQLKSHSRRNGISVPACKR